MCFPVISSCFPVNSRYLPATSRHFLVNITEIFFSLVFPAKFPAFPFPYNCFSVNSRCFPVISGCFPVFPRRFSCELLVIYIHFRWIPATSCFFLWSMIVCLRNRAVFMWRVGVFLWFIGYCFPVVCKVCSSHMSSLQFYVRSMLVGVSCDFLTIYILTVQILRCFPVLSYCFPVVSCGFRWFSMVLGVFLCLVGPPRRCLKSKHRRKWSWVGAGDVER